MILANKNPVGRHAAAAVLAVLLVYIFWLSRPEWSPDMRLWRAVGDASFILLFAVLAVGPLARLWDNARGLLPWRRELGIWFAIMAAIHAFLIFQGWALWNITRLLGYEFIPQLDRWARLEPGFGLANLLGITALILALVLAATSSDRAVRYLGVASWKWLHYGAYIIFYLVALHVAYFMFMHYTASYHRPVPSPNWFQYFFLGLALTVPLLQTVAFVKTVRSQHSGPDSGYF